MLLGLEAEAVTAGGGERSDFLKVAALLRRIDELPPDANGALVFGDASQSVVLIEGGRVCWAAAPSLRTRLSDRLRHATHLGAAEWDAVFRECVESRKPLGQTLVQRGVLSPSDLREALVEHTSAALAQLAHDRQEPRWMLATERRYDAQFTFSPAELLVHASDAQWGPLAQHARATLGSLLRNGGCGCAFVATESGVVPIGVQGLEVLGASGVLELAEWGARFLSSALADAYVTAVLREDGPSAAAWIDDGIRYAALCSERSDLVNVLAQLRRSRG